MRYEVNLESDRNRKHHREGREREFVGLRKERGKERGEMEGRKPREGDRYGNVGREM